MDASERDVLTEARSAIHRLCLERGSTDGYGTTMRRISELLTRPSTDRGAVAPEQIVAWLRGRTGAHGGGFTSADDVADAIEREFVSGPDHKRGAVPGVMR